MKDGKNEVGGEYLEPHANAWGYMLSPLRGWLSATENLHNRTTEKDRRAIARIHGRILRR